MSETPKTGFLASPPNYEGGKLNKTSCQCGGLSVSEKSEYNVQKILTLGLLPTIKVS